jgi:hypothetical protein
MSSNRDEKRARERKARAQRENRRSPKLPSATNNQWRIGEGGVAYAERNAYLRNAWKGGTDRTSWPVDTFHDAFIAAHSGDAEPLSKYLTSDEPLSAENRKALAGLISLWCDLLPDEKGKPRKRRRAGTPGGKHLRWQNRNLVAAFIADKWKKAQGKNVKDEDSQKFIDHLLASMETWPVRPKKKTKPRKRRPAKKAPVRLKEEAKTPQERVRDTLRKPRSRRLVASKS